MSSLPFFLRAILVIPVRAVARTVGIVHQYCVYLCINTGKRVYYMGGRFGQTMKTDVRVPIILVSLLLLPGCISGLVDDVDEPSIWNMSPNGEWPQLSLGERTRTTPTLEVYDDCTVLLQDLKLSLIHI